ncbi:MAG: hypothetical protein DID90_2727553595 [Candidatus Nitrotoga sp. LAW]|nr:MAG: hypothetical protein DID90_2727553595 [Candidatus Nitrotoga sp. LAW]
MDVWKSIPSWFKLDNYDHCANYSSLDWANELIMRCGSNIAGGELSELDKQIVEHIKNNGLSIRGKSYCYSEELKKLYEDNPSTYKKTRFAVTNLSQITAYSFFLDANNKEKIEHDFSLLDLSTCTKERWRIRSPYTHPIANLNYNHENAAYLEINLHASNEQLLMEFKDWLLETRGDTQDIVKRQFSKADFEDWHTSRVFAYWDLTTIAASENATIPLLMLGRALFPDEFDVELAARIQKVTKKKSKTLFSPEVVNALMAQAESEKTQWNNS